MRNIFANIPFIKVWFNFLTAVIYKIKSNKLTIGYNNELRNVIFGMYIALGNNVSIKATTIKSYTYVSENTVIRNSKVGKFCSIGPSVKIGLGKHPFNEFISSHPLFYSNRNQIGISILKKSKYKEFETVEIGNDVWIGANVIILDGVKVGNGAVIAAGSVVINDVKPFELVAGVPAKHKKFKFSEEKIKSILKDPWWNKDLNELKNIIE